jgi:hypothetical protein
LDSPYLFRLGADGVFLKGSRWSFEKMCSERKKTRDNEEVSLNGIWRLVGITETESNKALQNCKANYHLPLMNSRAWRGKIWVSPTEKAYITTQKMRGRGAALRAAWGRRKAEQEGHWPAHLRPPGRNSTASQGLVGGARIGGGVGRRDAEGSAWGKRIR